MQTILTRTTPAERGPVIRFFSKENSAAVGILAALIALVLVSINLKGMVDTFAILAKTGLYSSAKFNMSSPEDDWTMAIFDSFLEIVVGAVLFETIKMISRKKTLILTATATALGIGVGLGIWAGSFKFSDNYSPPQLFYYWLIILIHSISELFFPHFLLLAPVVLAVFGAIAITIGRIAALLPIAAFALTFKIAAMLTRAFTITGEWPFQWVIELLIVLGSQLMVCAFSFMIAFATQRTSFRGADLTNATFNQAKLGNTNFSKARLENANFRGAKI
ncbi:pentapeptide repeat-containing protein [Cyanobacteria bacterium FACHB-472]|nr:pentapeptide repeat-containing protein [Cyanobacteria bacterium FACHB-472]